MHSFHICGTVPVFQLLFISFGRFFFAAGPRWSSILFVILSGPGDLFSVALQAEQYGVLHTVKGEFMTGSPDVIV